MDKTGLTIADFAELCDDYNNDKITYNEFAIKFWNKYYDALKPKNLVETCNNYTITNKNIIINN